jgi:hypothetical protein
LWVLKECVKLLIDVGKNVKLTTISTFQLSPFISYVGDEDQKG